VEDVGGQVLFHLSRINPAKIVMDKPGILIATDLTPAETSHFDPATVLGICTSNGGPTSRTAILVRGLGIPAVVGLEGGVFALRDGLSLIVDGENVRFSLTRSPRWLINIRSEQKQFKNQETKCAWKERF